MLKDAEAPDCKGGVPASTVKVYEVGAGRNPDTVAVQVTGMPMVVLPGDGIQEVMVGPPRPVTVIGLHAPQLLFSSDSAMTPLTSPAEDLSAQART